MNSKFIASTVLALAAVTSMSAFAAEGNDFVLGPVTSSTVTRAQVQSELTQARSQGNVGTIGDQVNLVKSPSTTSTTSGSDLRNEAAIANRKFHRLYSV